ncbi:LLM class flavin-dependent oxidoreductase [Nocardia sp. NPDC048505]|uniref:LLM class flavin-dependent oxidoreductase n=1 Tax=unclassified Nocardia TaxID=2637762 RepID=UPI0033F67FB0
MSVPLSVLDLAPISAGSSARQALRNTIDLAQRAEQWGYHRFWLAEHHFVAVASSSSITLIGQVAAATTRIRVGSAAVQLGHHTSVSIVEAFGTIDALHPGRLDLGVGRSGHRKTQFGAEPARPRGARPVLDAATGRTQVRDGVVIPPPFDPGRVTDRTKFLAGLRALHQEGAQPQEFTQQIDDLRALLAGTYTTPEGVALQAVPGTGAQVDLWLFGSSGGVSAELAGRLGLPFAAAYHVAPGTALDAVDAYRAAFRPSVRLAEPYVVVSADVLVAETDAAAQRLAATYGHWVYGIRSGAGAPEYPDPAHTAPLTADQQRLVADRTGTQFVGSPATVTERLAALQRVSGADELLITSVAHDHADRLESHRLLAEAWSARAVRAA